MLIQRSGSVSPFYVGSKRLEAASTSDFADESMGHFRTASDRSEYQDAHESDMPIATFPASCGP
jgi:hypothetical protein